MKVIYKYMLSSTSSITKLDLPIDSNFISIKLISEVPCLYYMIDTNKPSETKTFQVLLTGEEIKPLGNIYNLLGTLVMRKGDFVIHIFEIKNK